MSHQENRCPVTTTLNVIGGKWKVIILWRLTADVLRFSELRRRIPKITQKMLTQQLRELEADGLVRRKVYAVVPPRVEYSISPYGKTLQPLLMQMCEWVTYIVNGKPVSEPLKSGNPGRQAVLQAFRPKLKTK